MKEYRFPCDEIGNVRSSNWNFISGDDRFSLDLESLCKVVLVIVLFQKVCKVLKVFTFEPFLMLLLRFFWTEQTSADFAFEHELFRLLLVRLAWFYIKLVTIFLQRFAGKWRLLLKCLIGLFILNGLTRKPKIIFKSEGLPGFFVERVKMLLLEFRVGKAMRGWAIRTEFVHLMLFVIIEIDALVSERRGGIIVDIIINHYWLGLIFLKITLYNFPIKFV